jgi:hypothetical protein
MSNSYPGLCSKQHNVLSPSNAFDWQFLDGELKQLSVSEKASMKFIEDADKWELSHRKYWNKHKYVIVMMINFGCMSDTLLQVFHQSRSLGMNKTHHSTKILLKHSNLPVMWNS